MGHTTVVQKGSEHCCQKTKGKRKEEQFGPVHSNCSTYYKHNLWSEGFTRTEPPLSGACWVDPVLCPQIAHCLFLSMAEFSVARPVKRGTSNPGPFNRDVCFHHEVKRNSNRAMGPAKFNQIWVKVRSSEAKFWNWLFRLKKLSWLFFNNKVNGVIFVLLKVNPKKH